LVPEQKIRCQTPLFDAGGGGINVSKAISRLEGKSLAVITSGSTGEMLKKALQEESISFEAIETKKWDTGNLLHDNTNSQFRFVFRHHPLQSLKKDKINYSRTRVQLFDCKWRIERGMPVDFINK
jgi:6-phosphofructokinase 2